MDASAMRVSVINENVLGMLSKITKAFARSKVNVVQQINQPIPKETLPAMSLTLLQRSCKKKAR
jgi:ACT domain-containing protein